MLNNSATKLSWERHLTKIIYTHQNRPKFSIKIFGVFFG